MSDAPQGTGWWQASDGRWYPPQPQPQAQPQGQPQQPTFPAPQWPAPSPQFHAPVGFGPGIPPPRSGMSTAAKVLITLGVLGVLLVGGCVALVAIGSNAVDNELKSNDASVVAPTNPQVAGSPETPETPETVGSGTGTRTSPLPLGTEVDLGNGWRVKVNSLTVDADAAVAGANQFNDPPDAGKRFILVNLTASFMGRSEAQTESPFLGVNASVFGSSNVEHQSSDTFVVAPEPSFDSIAELAAGGRATGNMVFVVDEAETALVLRVEPTFSFDSTEAWLALG